LLSRLALRIDLPIRIHFGHRHPIPPPRDFSIRKADFGASPDQDFRILFAARFGPFGGRFSPNIEMMTQFQAIGIVVSSGTTTSPAAFPGGGGRYPNTILRLGFSGRI